MAKEIERKFLLADGASIPIPNVFRKFKIKQAYIHAEEDKQVRVRIMRDIAILCVKYTSDIIRDEFEYEIPQEDAKVMYEKSVLKLEKERLSFKRFRNSKEHYDIDTYPNGLVVVEVEFKSIADMEKWEKPSWVGEEITNERRFSNISIAKEILNN